MFDLFSNENYNGVQISMIFSGFAAMRLNWSQLAPYADLQEHLIECIRRNLENESLQYAGINILSKFARIDFPVHNYPDLVNDVREFRQAHNLHV